MQADAYACEIIQSFCKFFKSEIKVEINSNFQSYNHLFFFGLYVNQFRFFRDFPFPISILTTLLHVHLSDDEDFDAMNILSDKKEDVYDNLYIKF